MDLAEREQFRPALRAISPNNEIHALVDHEPATGPLAVFESGAMSVYLAEKTGRSLPAEQAARIETWPWPFCQVGGLEPMAGQNHHFPIYAPEPMPYALRRHVKETARLYAVLDRRLSDQPYSGGNYSIADMPCYPGSVPHAQQGRTRDDFPHVSRCFHGMAALSAV